MLIPKLPHVQILRPIDKAEWLEARGKDVTASQVGALFGEHDYVTAYQLWAEKSGRLPRSLEDSPAMRRGRLLEAVAVQILREDYPHWEISHNAAENIYYRDASRRLGATPDVLVRNKSRASGDTHRGTGIIQIKSVEAGIYRRNWLDSEGNPEAPFWIALQATLEAALVGTDWAAVAPLVIGHGIDMPLIDIPLIPGVVDVMAEKTAEFWAMVREGREPMPDFTRDGPLLDRLYPTGDENHEVDLSGSNRIPDLLETRRMWLEQAREAKANLDSIDAEVKNAMGDAYVGYLADGRKITWMPQKREGSFLPSSTIRALRYPQNRN